LAQALVLKLQSTAATALQLGDDDGSDIDSDDEVRRRIDPLLSTLDPRLSTLDP
jgi:hypothetical protein